MKEKLIFATDYLFSKLGYFKIQQDNKDLINNLSSALYNESLQVKGLLNAVGEIQLQNDTNNLVIAALIALRGDDSVELTTEYLAEVQKQGLLVHQDANAEKLTLTLVTDEEESV